MSLYRSWIYLHRFFVSPRTKQEPEISTFSKQVLSLKSILALDQFLTNLLERLNPPTVLGRYQTFQQDSTATFIQHQS